VRDALVYAVQTGRVTEERIDESVRRILRLKGAFGLLEVGGQVESVLATRGQDVAEEISRLSITLLRDDSSMLPWAVGTRLLVITPDDGLRVYYPDANQRTPLGLALEDAGFQVRELTYRAKISGPQAEVRSLALSLANQYDAVLVGTWDAAISTMPSSAWQQALVPDIVRSNPRVIGIALRTPYDALLFPEVTTFLATYGGVPAQMRALAQVLLGTFTPVGVSPVALYIMAPEQLVH